MKKEAERYFFKYAFPCAFLKLERKEITKKEYGEMEEKFCEGNTISKSKLERIFKPAFVRIKRLAKRMNKDYWNFDVIKEYWLNEHNRIIDSNEEAYSETTSAFKDLCRIHKAEVTEKKENSLIVSYRGKKRRVYNTIVQDAREGNKVTIHFAYAIEKI